MCPEAGKGSTAYSLQKKKIILPLGSRVVQYAQKLNFGLLEVWLQLEPLQFPCTICYILFNETVKDGAIKNNHFSSLADVSDNKTISFFQYNSSPKKREMFPKYT